METNLVKTNNGLAKQETPTLQSMLSKTEVKKRFEEMLGKKAAGFISSIISATKTNKELAKCAPESVISAAVIAATLDLPIQNNLGFAAIIPYGSDAQFQMMWRGYVQLAMRTAQYLTINVSEVYEGELISENRITGEYVFDTSKKSSDIIVGYVAYFKMVNGFFKYFYWTVAQVTAHAKKYSQTFKSDKKYVVDKSRWTLDFDAMAKKTVLKLLLGRYGILSVDLQLALITDQGVIKDAGTIDIDYVDNKEEDVDKEDERIKLMIEGSKTFADLDELFVHIKTEEQKDLFNSKKDEISAAAESIPNEIYLEIETTDSIPKLNDLRSQYPQIKETINARIIAIGKSLQKGVKV